MSTKSSMKIDRTAGRASATVLGWLLAMSGALLIGAVVATLYWPRLAQATTPTRVTTDAIPPNGAFFESLRVLGATDAEGEDARIKIIAREPVAVFVVHNTFAPVMPNTPIASTGWHSHPGPSVVVVKTGTATVYEGDDPSCTPHTYPAGTAFIDHGGGHVHLVRNEGTDSLEVYAFQIIPAGESRRIDAASPGYCPF